MICWDRSSGSSGRVPMKCCQSMSRRCGRSIGALWAHDLTRICSLPPLAAPLRLGAAAGRGSPGRPGDVGQLICVHTSLGMQDFAVVAACNVAAALRGCRLCVVPSPP